MTGRRTVVVVGTGAGWEAEALALIERQPGLVLLKRCVDVDDLIATAATGQADVALVAIEAPGFDADGVVRVQQTGTVVIGVIDERHEAAQARAQRIGLRHLVDAGRLSDAVSLAVTQDLGTGASKTVGSATPLHREPVGSTTVDQPGESVDEPGRVLLVWGTPGAPGRSTVAAAIAAGLARAGRAVTLIDADPGAGTLAQQFGVVEEVSGLLAAGRLAIAGTLEDDWVRVARALDDRVWLVSGLPLPERWREVPVGTVTALVEAARSRGWVVVDVGAGVDRDRDRLTIEAFDVADEVLLVATPDPIGLGRLARAFAELDDQLADRVDLPVRVVLNQHRRTLHTGEAELVDLVTGALATPREPLAVHVLPHDRPAADAALLAHRALGSGSTGGARGAGLDRAMRRLAEAMVPSPAGAARRRRAGTGRRR